MLAALPKVKEDCIRKQHTLRRYCLPRGAVCEGRTRPIRIHERSLSQAGLAVGADLDVCESDRGVSHASLGVPVMPRTNGAVRAFTVGTRVPKPRHGGQQALGAGLPLPSVAELAHDCGGTAGQGGRNTAFRSSPGRHSETDGGTPGGRGQARTSPTPVVEAGVVEGVRTLCAPASGGGTESKGQTGGGRNHGEAASLRGTAGSLRGGSRRARTRRRRSCCGPSLRCRGTSPCSGRIPPCRRSW